MLLQKGEVAIWFPYLLGIIFICFEISSTISTSTHASIEFDNVTKFNDRPIIGILTQPSGNGEQYIAASYVKYIESGGGRVVPVFYTSTEEELDSIFSQINGLLFPGGGADLNGTQLYYAAKYLYDRALKANDKGDYFPIFGHCMGFELEALLTADGDQSVLGSCDAENLSLVLSFNNNTKESIWLGSADQSLLESLSKHPLAMNNHVRCLFPLDYERNTLLKAFYRVLSTSIDRQQRTFVALWEGIRYPIFGMQWHAEKNQFEWTPSEVINHSQEAIEDMQYFSSFTGKISNFVSKLFIFVFF